MSLHKIGSYIEIGCIGKVDTAVPTEVHVLQYRDEKRFNFIIIIFFFLFFGSHWRLAYIYVGTTITVCIRTE